MLLQLVVPRRMEPPLRTHVTWVTKRRLGSFLLRAGAVSHGVEQSPCVLVRH